MTSYMAVASAKSQVWGGGVEAPIENGIYGFKWLRKFWFKKKKTSHKLIFKIIWAHKPILPSKAYHSL